jgi:hypothetical protein
MWFPNTEPFHTVKRFINHLDPKNDSKIPTKSEKKFRKTFEKMEEFSFVTPITGFSRPNT